MRRERLSCREEANKDGKLASGCLRTAKVLAVDAQTRDEPWPA